MRLLTSILAAAVLWPFVTQAQVASPTPSVQLCWHEPGGVAGLVGYKLYLDGVEILRVPAPVPPVAVVGQDCTSQACYCTTLPWWIRRDQPQIFLTACTDWNQSCSAYSNEWPTPTRTVTPQFTATAPPQFTATPYPTYTPPPTQTAYPTYTAPPPPTETPTAPPAPSPPLIVCIGDTCVTVQP